MTFSIVIPTYNGEDFVQFAILSALNQTRPADEVLISDDNSTDKTVEICNRYNDKVKIYRNPKGPSGFVNGWRNAISLAESDYISILHQDDCLKPTFLEEAEKSLNENPDVKHLFVSCEYIDEKGHVTRNTVLSSESYRRYTGVEYVKAYQQLGNPHIHRCPGVITHKDIFKLCNYREEAGHIADDDFFYRVGQYTDIIGILKPLAQYREHSKSETGHLEEIKLIQRLIDDYKFQLQEMDSNTIFDNECKSYIKDWFVKLVEMEIIYSIKENNTNIYREFKKNNKLLDKYKLVRPLKLKFFQISCNLLGFSITHFIFSFFKKIIRDVET